MDILALLGVLVLMIFGFFDGIFDMFSGVGVVSLACWAIILMWGYGKVNYMFTKSEEESIDA